ncbi:MAG TPA: ribosome assembly RNA-binding protein YhbY [Candidatus Merdivicinus excrementipullorum]|uniref:Ribosome assembly RNA-binding protein YhbY n=1 Tax=Candidatus Merdivicinus excrementipullorum TaxID=2840867 RepID=A0A9D1FLC4_9FIRM|nr:ribosome assembly RNA-binding protein YhbY [Candidatus Merdivicinus excrementipullorum]HIV18535.1 ribosome assembly RNA-binding protein YhbY [Candidatus Merdivicinus intestinigallinarum]
MLNSKQRAKLRSMANSLETILQIGKGGISENTVKQVEDALKARELIKIRVLENSIYSAKEAANEIAQATGCDVVQVVGTRITLYKQNPEEPVIQLD